MLFGAPATGKSSLARDILALHQRLAAAESGPDARLLYLSTDSLREWLSGQEYVASLRPTVYRGLRAMAESAVRRGHHVLLDGNYLEERLRRPIVHLAERLGTPLLRVLTCCSLERSLRRNEARSPSERVPEEVVRRAHERARVAEAEADLIVNTEAGPSDWARQTLEWLLQTPLTMPADSLSDPALDEWKRTGKAIQLGPGQILWHLGERSDSVTLIVEGELEVVRQQSGLPDIVLNRLCPGELAGELSALEPTGGTPEDTPHSATVRSATPSRVSQLSKADFRALLRRHPQLVDLVLRGMAGRIRALSHSASTASVDLLTGLGNRRFFEDVFPALAQQATQNGEPLSLAVFDIDRFKGINDTYGHEAGDLVLRGLGGLLRQVVPPPCVAARPGGDEFLILMPGYTPSAALELVGALVAQLAGTEFPLPDAHLTVTISVGVASAPECSGDASQLYRLADEAAYVSKREGRNRVSFWTC